MTRKPANKKEEGTTSEPLSPPQPLALPFEPVPDDAVQRLLRTLYDLAIGGNTAAAKLFVDLMKDKTSDPAALTAEDALKILQEHFSKAA
jgi:hypothetical protein